VNADIELLPLSAQEGMFSGRRPVNPLVGD